MILVINSFSDYCLDAQARPLKRGSCGHGPPFFLTCQDYKNEGLCEDPSKRFFTEVYCQKTCGHCGAIAVIEQRLLREDMLSSSNSSSLQEH